MAVLVTTQGAAGGLIASAGLTAGANVQSASIDLTGKLGAWVTVQATMGGTVAATRGIRVSVQKRYGSSGSNFTSRTSQRNVLTFATATAASGVERSSAIWLEAGTVWRIDLENLDTANSVTVEASLDTLDSIT